MSYTIALKLKSIIREIVYNRRIYNVLPESKTTPVVLPVAYKLRTA